MHQQQHNHTFHTHTSSVQVQQLIDCKILQKMQNIMKHDKKFQWRISSQGSAQHADIQVDHGSNTDKRQHKRLNYQHSYSISTDRC